MMASPIQSQSTGIMSEISKNDRVLMGFLQKEGPKSVAELAGMMEVTENAVRQRLTRLIALGLISRVEEKLSRGRPLHKYSVTREGRASAGQNFSDLAAVVWDEVRAIEDVETRSQVVRGIAKRLAAKYQDEMDSEQVTNGRELTPKERAETIAQFFESRGIPVTVNDQTENNDATVSDGVSKDKESPFPILQLHGCPYPGLSDRDELICEMEQSMFSELAGCDVELHRCNADGKSACCTFQPESVEDKPLVNVANGNET